MNGYRMYDVLTRGQSGFPGIWRNGMFRDGVDDGKIFLR